MDDLYNISGSQDESEKLPGFLGNEGVKPPFSVPPGYFNGLAGRIVEKCVAAENLGAEAPVLSGIEKVNPFIVPAGYFNKLTLAIQEKCTNEEPSPDFIQQLEGKVFPSPFKVPQTYFENLARQVQDKVNKKQSQRHWLPLPAYLSYPRLALAAVAAAMFIAVFYFRFYNHNAMEKHDTNLALTAEDLCNSSYFFDLDEGLLAESVEPPGRNGNEPAYKNIENYLMDNHFDEDMIITE